MVESCVTVERTAMAGFSSEERLIFVRPEVAAQWSFCNATLSLKKNGCIGGPPGTGKSTAMWAWALHRAKEHKKCITWFHFSANDVVKAVLDGANGTIKNFSADFEDLADSDGDVLIIDGVTKGEDSKKIMRACSTWSKQHSRNTFFTLSSVSSGKAAAEQNDEARIETWFAPSWGFDQYKAACGHPEFFNAVKDKLRCPSNSDKDSAEELLESKYFLAGACARWMFDFDHKKCLADVEWHLGKVSDFSLLFQRSIGEAASTSVNHLLSATVVSGRQTVNYFFVSRYVASEVARLSNETGGMRKFIVEGYRMAAAIGNPSLCGWIFEIDVAHQLEEAAKSEAKAFVVSILGNDGEQQQDYWRVSRFKLYESDTDLATLVQSLEMGETLWVKPHMFNQPSFDFLRFEFQKDEAGKDFLIMRPANATVAHKHALSLHPVHNIAKMLLNETNLSVDVIRFDFLVDAAVSDFRIGSVTGRLSNYWSAKVPTMKWPNRGIGSTLEQQSGCVVVARVSRTSS